MRNPATKNKAKQNTKINIKLTTQEISTAPPLVRFKIGLPDFSGVLGPEVKTRATFDSRPVLLFQGTIRSVCFLAHTCKCERIETRYSLDQKRNRTNKQELFLE
jgi:hypothetical protein